MRLFDRAVVRVLPAVPRSVVRRIAAPYIAGETLDDARRVVRELNAAGVPPRSTFWARTSRGPRRRRRSRAPTTTRSRRSRRERLDANVSIKLTGLGSSRQGALPHARRRGRGRRREARDLRPHRHGGLVDHGRHARSLSRAPGSRPRQRRRGTAGGSPAHPRRHRDARRPPAERATLQGIYVEPPSVAFQEPDVVPGASSPASTCYWMRVVVSGSRRTTSGSSTRRSNASPGSTTARTSCSAARLRADRGRALVAAGHPLRVYVPYGLRWYEYSLRRLQENPKVAGYVARDMLGRIVPGGESA